MNKNEFIDELKKLGIEVLEEQMQKLEIYYDILVEWNNKINLTRIVDKEEVYLKHFYDSATLIKAINLKENIKICDIGTGAGFPGIVLKIIFPNLSVTLVDSLKKRTDFLNDVIKRIELKNIEVLNERGEDFIKGHREEFDLITCRALSKLNIISEICIPGVKINGYFIPMKANVEDEIKNTEYLSKLGAKIEAIKTFYLPKENSIRNLIMIKKLEKTDIKYPRQYNIILRKSI